MTQDTIHPESAMQEPQEAAHDSIRADMDDLYHALLLDYTAGRLNEAQNMIVAAHIALSAPARQWMKQYESLGGYVLERECLPVSMCETALDKVLARLEPGGAGDAASCCAGKSLPEDAVLPEPLRSWLTGQKHAPRWSFFSAGARICRIDLDCTQAHMRLLRAKPRRAAPHDTDDGLEIILVLEGAYIEQGARYRRGDLMVRDEQHLHPALMSCPQDGCLSLVVSDAPPRFSALARWMNAVLRR